MLKVNFGDDKWLRVPGSSAVGEIGGGDGTMGPKDAGVYLSLSLRNVGSGIAVLHGWRFHAGRPPADDEPPPLDEFRMQTRDMYIPPGDIGFWQGALRNLDDPQYLEARKAVEEISEWVVELLYGDEDGGQRVIGRFRVPAKPMDRSAQPDRRAGRRKRLRGRRRDVAAHRGPALEHRPAGPAPGRPAGSPVVPARRDQRLHFVKFCRLRNDERIDVQLGHPEA